MEANSYRKAPIHNNKQIQSTNPRPPAMTIKPVDKQ